MKEMGLDSDFFIFNRLPSLYSARRFQEEIDRTQYKGLLISPEVFKDWLPQIESQDHRPAVLYRQGDFEFWSTHALVCNYSGPIVNSPSTFLRARDKWVTYLTWQHHSIPTPKTARASDIFSNDDSTNRSNFNYENLFTKCADVFGVPFILKKRFSSQGRGVFLIHDNIVMQQILSKETFSSHCFETTYFQSEELENPSTPVFLTRWLIQECIHECLGQDVRCFQTTHRRLAIERTNTIHFLSNLHQGGHPRATEMTSDEDTLASLIFMISGLKYAGIDFLRSKKGPLFLEINPSPGFEGIESIYSVNVADDLIKLVLRAYV